MRIVVEQRANTSYETDLLIIPIEAYVYTSVPKLMSVVEPFIQQIAYDIFFFKHDRGWRICNQNKEGLTSDDPDIRFMMSRLIRQIYGFRREVIADFFISKQQHRHLEFSIQEFSPLPPPIEHMYESDAHSISY